MHFSHLPLMHRFYIDWFVLKPAQIISNQMDVIATSTSHHHYSFVVWVLCERSDGLSVADCASKFEDVKVSAVCFYSWHFRKNGDPSICFEIIELLSFQDRWGWFDFDVFQGNLWSSETFLLTEVCLKSGLQWADWFEFGEESVAVGESYHSSKNSLKHIIMPIKINQNYNFKAKLDLRITGSFYKSLVLLHSHLSCSVSHSWPL